MAYLHGKLLPRLCALLPPHPAHPVLFLFLAAFLAVYE